MNFVRDKPMTRGPPFPCTRSPQAKKETNFYLKKVDQAKAIEAMEERKGKKRKAGAEEEGDAQPAQKPRDYGAAVTGDGGSAASAGLSQVMANLQHPLCPCVGLHAHGHGRGSLALLQMHVEVRECMP